MLHEECEDTSIGKLTKGLVWVHLITTLDILIYCCGCIPCAETVRIPLQSRVLPLFGPISLVHARTSGVRVAGPGPGPGSLPSYLSNIPLWVTAEMSGTHRDPDGLVGSGTRLVAPFYDLYQHSRYFLVLRTVTH